MTDRLLYQVRGYSGRITEAVIEIEEPTPAQRGRRALATLGAWWVAAIACVAIPIAHFVLVPGCLLLGVVMMLHRLGVRRVVASATATCPDCGVAQPLDLHGAWRGVTGMSCRACQRSLILTPASAEAS